MDAVVHDEQAEIGFVFLRLVLFIPDGKGVGVEAVGLVVMTEIFMGKFAFPSDQFALKAWWNHNWYRSFCGRDQQDGRRV